MDSSSESDLELISPKISEAPNRASINLIPEISKEKYEKTYKCFTDWQAEKVINSNSEKVLLTYFDELSQKFKASTLWSQYSMLRTMLNIHQTVDISNYLKLRQFLKRNYDGYKPKKSRFFTTNEINRFIKDAPDELYLLDKVS